MRILFIHQNFPAQFKYLAPTLAKQHQVRILTLNTRLTSSWQGIPVNHYSLQRISTKGIHPWIIDFEAQVIRGEATLYAALNLRQQGFTPDVIIAHPGWGESIALKDVWPNAKLGLYCEFFYHAEGADVGFDPEFPNTDPAQASRIRLKNTNTLIQLSTFDAGISPTYWQASTFPELFRHKISVIHDGIDSAFLQPNPSATLTLKTNSSGLLTLSKGDEIITFVNRNLEPYRGYHIFMRCLPKLLKQRPYARVLLVGGDGTSYGAKPSRSKSWKEQFIDEVRPQISDADWSRVHFLGNLPYHHFVALLQRSSLHVYLTYPFVLSWSLLEAMSIGCAIVASDTSPVHDAIIDSETGRLVNFFDYKALADEISLLLDNPVERQRLGANARAFIHDKYDLKTICLPKQIKWVENILK